MRHDRDFGGIVTVVLADANVLYSRVLRDYILYASGEQLISVRWSQEILDEFSRHLISNRKVTREQSKKLLAGMNEAFPYALVNPTKADYQRFANLEMPDPDDRHVVAAAVAAEADVLCTLNAKDFPDPVMQRVGIQRVSPDTLLSGLAVAHPEEMLRVHRTSVALMRNATDESTLLALDRAGASRTADTVATSLGLEFVREHQRAGRQVRAYLRRR